MFAQERTPLEEFVDGFPIELDSRTRKASYEELFRGGDISAYFNVRTSEFMDTAVLPARQPQMLLGSCTPSYPGRCAVTADPASAGETACRPGRSEPSKRRS
jgi:hypothetical protein